MKHNFKFPEPKVASSNSLFYSTTSPKDIYDHIWQKKPKFSHLRSCSQRIFGPMCVIYQFPKYCLVTNQLMIEEIWRYLWVWMYVYDLCTWVFPCFLVVFGTWFVFFPLLCLPLIIQYQFAFQKRKRKHSELNQGEVDSQAFHEKVGWISFSNFKSWLHEPSLERFVSSEIVLNDWN